MSATLEVNGLTVQYPTDAGVFSALDDVSLSVQPGEIVGIVGESGCGKSTFAHAAMGLLPESATVLGEISVGGERVDGLDEARLRTLRGSRMAMILQDASASLDPTWPVGPQIAEAVRAHAKISRRAAKARALELMAEVGIPDPEPAYGQPPHRLSGGQRQRMVIAAALANDPDLLIADEPTTALDVTVQAQVMALICAMRDRHGTSVLLITHDLGLVSEYCDRVAVMYAGQLVEVLDVADLFTAATHPYTVALLSAMPVLHSSPERLATIPGQVPDLSSPPPGCRFADRCPRRLEQCSTRPELTPVGRGRVACWNPEPREERAA